jgi:pSer/pThr/pTyr-binding forkhead associated (FHA) protein
MKFCRSCGSALPSLAAVVASAPGMGAPGMGAGMAGMSGMPPSGPLRTPMPMPPPNLGATQMPGGALPPTLPPPSSQSAGAPQGLPPAQIVATPQLVGAMPPTMPGPVAPKTAAGSTISCPRCGTQTPLGFAYCQNCGLHMQAVVPTDPTGTGARPRQPSSAPPPIAAAMVPRAQVDVQAATLAADPAAAAAMIPPRSSPDVATPVMRIVPNAPAPAPGAAWGTVVLVNRDGSDGQRFPLSSDDTVIGRAGADIAFDDDRFLARQHARIGRDGGGVKLHPLDALNGVFKKADGPVELGDGAVVLVGREVLRFERVDPEERAAQPLVRHGVALFGSPPRDPWGRVVQLVPSGGARDIRHLVGDEVVLGREEGDIVFRDDAFMSRRHAALTWDGKQCRITDLGSSNGTFIRFTTAVALKHGDHIRVGDQLLRIEIGG